MWQIERVRVAPARHDAHRRENNFARRNRASVGGVECLTPGGVPPSPQPLTHPAKDPGPSGAGVFFCLQHDNDKASAGPPAVPGVQELVTPRALLRSVLLAPIPSSSARAGARPITKS
jgi:hypothetical protein